MLGTGCRIGEVLGLRWQDIDFKNRTININHNLVYRAQDDGTCINRVNSPKTSAGIRIIPMLDEMFDAFLEEYQYQKVMVEIIKRIHRENLSFKGASREYGISDRTLRDWERIYWEEGEEALLLERRGRACAASGTQKGRKPKLDKQVEEDLIAENQRLRMENDYLKKLNALVLEEERQNRKHK